jgi:hypothetical protein
LVKLDGASAVSKTTKTLPNRKQAPPVRAMTVGLDMPGHIRASAIEAQSCLHTIW